MQFGTQPSNVTLSQVRQGFFGRMFNNLPPCNCQNDDELFKLAESMQTDDSDKEIPTGDNQNIPAGYTYFAQFVDHDITFDPTSSTNRFNNPNLVPNFRTPSFDLDCMYGNGPEDAPYLYDPNDFSLLIGENSNNEEDLIRVKSIKISLNKRAIIGDHRNDENTNVSQMHLAFIKFHNAVIEVLKNLSKFKNIEEDRVKKKELFEDAKRIVTWHYQYVIINDLVKRLTNSNIYQSKLPVRKGSKQFKLEFFKWMDNIFIPVEFSVAAFRLGHSMVRSSYNLNSIHKNIPIFSDRASDKKDLSGFRELPKHYSITWHNFLDFKSDCDHLQFSRKLDTKLSINLKNIGPSSLALLNLQKGFRMELPSGQDVAKTMGIEPIPKSSGLSGDDPLWFYILKEAELKENGTNLGEVGSHILVEVFIGLLLNDPKSFLSINPNWDPSKEQLIKIDTIGKTFELRDIIKFAGMPII